MKGILKTARNLAMVYFDGQMEGSIREIGKMVFRMEKDISNLEKEKNTEKANGKRGNESLG